MCFSPVASFTAAGVLGATGIATLKLAKTKAEVPLALLPLIFAVQQFVEGLVSLSLLSSHTYLHGLALIYTFFAFLFWPAYIPWVVWSLERDAMRRKMMIAFGIVGTAVGVWLYYIYIMSGALPQIVNRCIVYEVNPMFPTLVACMYGLATLGASMLTSRRFLNLFGLLMTISAFIAWVYYTQSFSSVWCFFAAALSFLPLFYFLRSAKPKRLFH